MLWRQNVVNVEAQGMGKLYSLTLWTRQPSSLSLVVSLERYNVDAEARQHFVILP